MIHQTLAPWRMRNTQSNSHGNDNVVSHMHWRRQARDEPATNQKLHRSCNDLELTDNSTQRWQPKPAYNEQRFLGSTNNYNRRGSSNNMWQQRPQSSDACSSSVSQLERVSDRQHQQQSQPMAHSHSNCNIVNCGKVLWLRRETTAPRVPPLPASLSFSIRTNTLGLPYTPSPVQRQAYLANQHAVAASIPLLLHEQQQQQQQQQRRRQQYVGKTSSTWQLQQLPVANESPNRYYDTDVNIHFKTPIRHEYKQSVSEEELAIRQAEHMQKLYHEERRRKYLQELQDMNSRRHTDNFTPSQKSPIALNRYDDFPTDVTLKSLVGPKTVARALYNFQGQTSKELSFRKGDTIYIRRQIDDNWYEGEHNAMIGLLPVSYVEIISHEGARTPGRRPSEGQARAKYNFQAQSGIELSLNKGELVTLTRRVDGNWFEGKIANRKGIFPVSYVEILTDIGAEDIAAKTTTVINSHSTTHLRPTMDVLRTNINNEFNTLTQNGTHPPNGILKDTKQLHKTDMLHVETSSEPLAYRALYKYRPQNSDELELLEGDLVHVLEKCDDGWFVGTSQRTGCFGTFPGNYVERA